jgi:ABC-2 type transport system permease protein
LFDYLQLVMNENMKIYRRVRTWIMLGILLLLAAAFTILLMAFETVKPSMWDVMQMEASFLIVFVTIFAVVVSAESVAGEFSTGTIKLLLIRPWTRSKILLSKYISLLLFAAFFTSVLFVFTLLLNLIVFGTDPSFSFPGRDEGPLQFMLTFYGYKLVELLMVVTMSFMISTVFRSGGLAIGLSIFLLLGGSTLAGILSVFDYEWPKYVIFVHMNLTQHLNGTPLIEGVTLGFSLAVLAVYYIFFVALSWFVFNKRDVAA